MRWAFITTALFAFWLLSGCGEDKPVEKSTEQLTGKRPIQQGRRMKDQIDRIRRDREEERDTFDRENQE
jgi:hypothetical protein